jgi:hypothetical protein
LQKYGKPKNENVPVLAGTLLQIRGLLARILLCNALLIKKNKNGEQKL